MFCQKKYRSHILLDWVSYTLCFQTDHIPCMCVGVGWSPCMCVGVSWPCMCVGVGWSPCMGVGVSWPCMCVGVGWSPCMGVCVGWSPCMCVGVGWPCMCVGVGCQRGGAGSQRIPRLHVHRSGYNLREGGTCWGSQRLDHSTTHPHHAQWWLVNSVVLSFSLSVNHCIIVVSCYFLWKPSTCPAANDGGESPCDGGNVILKRCLKSVDVLTISVLQPSFSSAIVRWAGTPACQIETVNGIESPFQMLV